MAVCSCMQIQPGDPYLLKLFLKLIIQMLDRAIVIVLFRAIVESKIIDQIQAGFAPEIANVGINSAHCLQDRGGRIIQTSQQPVVRSKGAQ